MIPTRSTIYYSLGDIILDRASGCSRYLPNRPLNAEDKYDLRSQVAVLIETLTIFSTSLRYVSVAVHLRPASITRDLLPRWFSLVSFNNEEMWGESTPISAQKSRIADYISCSCFAALLVTRHLQLTIRTSRILLNDPTFYRNSRL